MTSIRKLGKIKKMMIPTTVHAIEIYDPKFPGLANIGVRKEETSGDVKKRFHQCLRTKGRWTWRGRGEDAGFFAGRYPTHEEMDVMDKYVIPCDVDPDIREVILDLNKAGYRTMGSCSGHPHSIKGHGDKGFVAIAKKGITRVHHEIREPLQDNRSKATSILKKHGLTSIKYVDHDSWYALEFNSVGKRMKAKKV